MTDLEKMEQWLESRRMSIFRETYTCYNCGVQSKPERSIRFLTEFQCWACYLIQIRKAKERRIAVCQVVAQLPESDARDVVLGLLK